MFCRSAALLRPKNDLKINLEAATDPNAVTNRK
jgi:hypothetical protein